MKKTLVFTFLFHIFCLTLLVVPNEYQGPVVLTASGVQLRTLDVAAVAMIILGSAFLNIYVFKNYWPQIKKIKQILKDTKN